MTRAGHSLNVLERVDGQTSRGAPSANSVASIFPRLGNGGSGPSNYRSITVRIAGLALLVVAFFAMSRLRALVMTPPTHPSTAAELLVSLVAVLTLLPGVAMLIIGPALFRPYLWPPAEE